MKHIVPSLIIAAVLTGLSIAVALWFGWITQIVWLEALAVFTAYSCTYMCVKQTVWNYPMGIISTALYSYLMLFVWGMPALGIFNLYLVFSLIYGAFRWGADVNTRPVTTIEPKWYAGYGVFGLIILGLFLAANLLVNPAGISALNPIDVGLAVASGVAQLMLDNKKLPTWWVWAGVNIVSIPFFAVNGQLLVAFQYVFFLANTVYGYVSWKNTMTSKT